VLAVVVVVLIVVAAFVMLGSPSHQRALALDLRRAQDLSDIARELHEQYGAAPLPAQLTAPERDPISGHPYEYRRLSPRDYLLCAHFDLPDTSTDRPSYASDFWHHAAGRVCYRLDARRGPPY
jgi:hypothetical protein